ncbi:MAG: fibronectin type III domain-containing protein [Candidatus Eisenbacteria bacterium]|nr:fibronectin type III domain-containing protein [Candidatus Eisenbacteria bacterium]
MPLGLRSRFVRFGALVVLLASLGAFAPGFAGAQSAPADSVPALAPPRGLVYADVPGDAGLAVELSWTLSPDDSVGTGLVTGYFLERSTAPGGPWTVVDSVVARTASYTDQSIRRDTPYFYRVGVFGPRGSVLAGAAAGPAIGRSSWFHSSRASVLAFLLLFFLLVLYYMYMAQLGRKPFVRRLAGIDAIEEAIGRATEMGRPVLYVPGVQDIDEIQTVAGLVILESVARMTARYDTPLRVPVAYPIPFTIAQEMVRSGHAHAGRPDAYDPDCVQFVSPEQFAYVAAITGIMMREKPAAHIFMGSFYGESLMLAETGFANGAIQVAGTANVHQLPFFVVACDYTLIGEEIFAASAYLSGEARLVGGLKGADMLKLVIVAVVLIGCALETFGIHGLTTWMQTQ